VLDTYFFIKKYIVHFGITYYWSMKALIIDKPINMYYVILFNILITSLWFGETVGCLCCYAVWFCYFFQQQKVLITTHDGFFTGNVGSNESKKNDSRDSTVDTVGYFMSFAS
jgi:hypothetical protein